MDLKQLKVDSIKNGTVIDHITSGKALQVAEILNLSKPTNLMMIGVNLSSNKMAKKDIIKIENKKLTNDEVNSIALVSPNATLIIIEGYKVVNKYSVKMPKKINKHIICPNLNCITNEEQIVTKFELANNKPVEIQCVYCEKKYNIDEVKFKF